jgi:translation initiation factor IF-2
MKGKLTLPALARVKRGGKVVAEDLEVVGLKRGPQEAKEVVKGEMCGLSFRSTSRVEVKEGDRVELFTRQSKSRKL